MFVVVVVKALWERHARMKTMINARKALWEKDAFWTTSSEREVACTSESFLYSVTRLCLKPCRASRLFPLDIACVAGGLSRCHPVPPRRHFVTRPQSPICHQYKMAPLNVHRIDWDLSTARLTKRTRGGRGMALKTFSLPTQVSKGSKDLTEISAAAKLEELKR